MYRSSDVPTQCALDVTHASLSEVFGGECKSIFLYM